MSEIGRMLREKRIERGLEISDVAKKTRIRDYYLRAIEDGRSQTMPEAYYRGYIKIYANFLSIDARLLKTAHEQKPNPQQPSTLVSDPTGSTQPIA